MVGSDDIDVFMGAPHPGGGFTTPERRSTEATAAVFDTGGDTGGCCEAVVVVVGLPHPGGGLVTPPIDDDASIFRPVGVGTAMVAAIFCAGDIGVVTVEVVVVIVVLPSIVLGLDGSGLYLLYG